MDNQIPPQQTPPQPPPAQIPSQQITPEKHTSIRIVILLFFLFSPAALLIMCKERYYHKALPILLWVYAIILLLVVGSLTFFVLPQLSETYALVQTNNPITFLRILNGIFIIILIGQIWFGFWARKKAKTLGFLSKKILTLCLIFILIDAITPSFVILSVVHPIYSLTSTIDTDTTTTPTNTPTPTDPIANWKTYENQTYQFNMKYPAEWIYKESNPKDIPTIIWFGIENKTRDLGIEPVIDLEIENIGSKSVKTWLAKSKLKPTKQKTEGNITTYEVHHSYCPSEGDCIWVIFKQGDNLYRLSSNADSETQKNLPIIYQMISTLKFTDQNQ